MRLTPEEMRLIHHLRGLPTCKAVIVKFAGQIKNVSVTVDMDVDAKARQTTALGPFQVRISEKDKP